MNHKEMDKFTIWLVGAFPQWEPDKCVAAVWANELPDVQADEAIEAVRRLQKTKPSPFPPGIFEICAALNGRLDPKKDARICFAEFWGAASTGKKVEASERASKAFKLATGGKGYGDALTVERDWHEKRFIELYEGLSEREAHENHPRLLGPERRSADKGAPLLAEGRPDLEISPGGDEKEGFGA